MASAHLSRTSGSPTNALKFTYSFWVKLSALENDTFLLDFNTDGNNRSNIGFETASNQFIVYEIHDMVLCHTIFIFGTQNMRTINDMERYYYGAGSSMGYSYSGSELLKADAP